MENYATVMYPGNYTHARLIGVPQNLCVALFYIIASSRAHKASPHLRWPSRVCN